MGSAGVPLLPSMEASLGLACNAESLQMNEYALAPVFFVREVIGPSEKYIGPHRFVKQGQRWLHASRLRV